MRETFFHLTIIVLIAGSVFFTNLGEARLWDRDEPRNAGCAAEMMARGDWVVPTFNDELRHQKPVLLYWLMMSAYGVFGVNEFSARFWSAALAIVTTLATYGIARRLVSPAVGLLAAIALATSMMFDVAARAATPDSVLICCSTLSIYIYVLGTFSPKQPGTAFQKHDSFFPKNVCLVIGMFVVMGLGVLAKGPIGFLIPMSIIGMFMLIARLPQRPALSSDRLAGQFWWRFKSIIRPFFPIHFLRTVWAMRPLLAACIILIVAAPWYLLVANATNGEFTNKFFVGEHFGRATEALENHAGGFWFYPVAILIGFFPWSVLWGPVAISMIGQKKSNADKLVITFLLCWIGVQVGLFSLAQTKLPSYVTPCYPALAILTAKCFYDFAKSESSLRAGWVYAAFGGLIVSGLAIVGGLGYATTTFLPNQVWLTALGVIPILFGVALMMMLKSNSKKHLPNVFACCSVLFCWLLFGFGTVSIDHEQQSHFVLGDIAASSSATVASFGCLESSWVFYAGKPIHELAVEDASEDSARLQSARQFWQLKPRVGVKAFLENHPGAMFITSSDHLSELKNRLPDDYQVIQSADYFLKNKQIYLLGSRESQTAEQRSRVYY